MPPRKRAPAKTAAKKTTTTRKAPAKKTAAQKRPSPGRPPLLEVDTALQTKIATFVRSGAFPERAAVAVGISESTHYAWQAKGLEELEHRDQGGKPNPELQMYVDYAQTIERAIAEAEMLLLGKAAAGGSTGTASMTILERRFRDRWGAKMTAAPPAPPSTSAAPATGLDMLEQRRAAREQKTS